jgi:5-formyltetrahydrofolate cyclo-ligase
LLTTPSSNTLSRGSQRQKTRKNRRTINGTVRQEAEHRLALQLLRLPQIQRARYISVYLAVRHELSLDRFVAFAARRNFHLFAPVLRGNTLTFALLNSATTLRLNQFGIPEPVNGPYIDVRSLDVVLAPLVAFDDNGVRLGMGGGYYDRCFKILRRRKLWWKPKLIGIGFERQHVQKIEAEKWDVRLWGAVTESRAYFF